jgi:hypothetical protein
MPLGDAKRYFAYLLASQRMKLCLTKCDYRKDENPLKDVATFQAQ